MLRPLVLRSWYRSIGVVRLLALQWGNWLTSDLPDFGCFFDGRRDDAHWFPNAAAGKVVLVFDAAHSTDRDVLGLVGFLFGRSDVFLLVFLHHEFCVWILFRGGSDKCL